MAGGGRKKKGGPWEGGGQRAAPSRANAQQKNARRQPKSHTRARQDVSYDRPPSKKRRFPAKARSHGGPQAHCGRTTFVSRKTTRPGGRQKTTETHADQVELGGGGPGRAPQKHTVPRWGGGVGGPRFRPAPPPKQATNGRRQDPAAGPFPFFAACGSHAGQTAALRARRRRPSRAGPAGGADWGGVGDGRGGPRNTYPGTRAVSRSRRRGQRTNNQTPACAEATTFRILQTGVTNKRGRGKVPTPGGRRCFWGVGGGRWWKGGVGGGKSGRGVGG